MFLDDISLGEMILQDIQVIESAFEIGLDLNNGKSEIITNDPISRGTILTSLLGGRVVDPLNACLLGSPLGNIDAVSAALRRGVSSVGVMGVYQYKVL